MAREVTLRDPRDTYVNQVVPTHNYADKSSLVVNGNNAGNAQRRVFLFFAPLPKDAFAVLSATLNFALKGDWPAGSHVVTAKRITQAWKENDVNWNNQPNVADLHAVTVTVTGGTGTGGDNYSIDVVDMLQDVADGDNWYGIRLAVDTDGNKLIHSAKAEVTHDRPRIDVSYAVQPDAPDTLHPDNGHGVAETKPLLQWDFDDATEDSTQTYSNIQIDNNISFASPVYDTGWQPNTLQHWNTADDGAMTNLSSGTTYYWRVRIKNNHGLQSEWSEIATFDRWSQGTLSITHPAADGNDIDDNEETISWSLTGRTQQFVEQILFRNDPHRDVRLHTWSKRASTDTSWDIPYGFVDTLGQSYGVHIHTWDDKNRSQKDFVEARRQFYFNPSTGVAPPTTFDVTVLGPYLEMTWRRSTTPDEWGIFADGVLIAQPDGADRLVSGNDYNYLYHGGTHNKPVALQVRAKTDGVGFSDNAGVVTKAPTHLGIWLIEVEVGIGVQLLGTAELGSTLGEDSTIFKLLNRRQPVKITSALHGYEGNAQGTLAKITPDGQDPGNEREILETLFANYSTSENLRLIGGSRNIFVNVSNLTVSEWPTAEEEIYDVSFDWVQSSGFIEVDD